MTCKFLLATLLITCFMNLDAQQKPKPEETEVYQPVPKVIDPGKQGTGVPSDAVVLLMERVLING